MIKFSKPDKWDELCYGSIKLYKVSLVFRKHHPKDLWIGLCSWNTSCGLYTWAYKATIAGYSMYVYGPNKENNGNG